MEERPASMVEGALQRLGLGPEPRTPRRLGSTVIPGAARALRKGPDAFPGKRASLDKALEKPHTRVAEVPRGTPGVPQRLQRRAGREAMSRVGTHTLGRSKGLAETATSWRRALIQRSAGHDRETTASGGRIAARTAGNLSRPPAGGRRIRDLSPLPLRRADAVRGLRPNPGFGRPGRTGVAGATRRSRRLVCVEALQRPVAGSTGPIPSIDAQDARGARTTRLARHPEGRQAIHTMSARSPEASSARGVPLAKRATVTEACSPLPVRSFLRAIVPGWAGWAHGLPALS
jgi:hypothetical protein